ncbi:MAG: hypothetical protein ABIH42_10160 [Planctomycetota bacterium]
MPELFVTQDIWLGGLFLAETNAELVDVQCNRNGRLTINFSFQGENLSRLAKDYCDNQAIANVTDLRDKLNKLRDLIFQAKYNN